MLATRQRKVKVLYQSQAIANNTSPTTTVLDTKGFDQVAIDVFLGATDIALTALKVQECDTSGGSYTDITGTRVGTDNDETGTATTLPSATDDNKVYSFEIDTRGRKRFLKVVFTIGNGSTGAFVVAVASLFRGHDTPRTAADAGDAIRMSV
jgi:hypothetical protein